MSESQSYYITEITVPDPLRKRLIAEAQEWASDVGALTGSRENGAGNTAGRYGELVFCELFDGTLADHYEYDIAYNGLHVDVKTKRRTVPAQPDYKASVPDFNTEQDADLYYFMSVRCGNVPTPYRHVDLLGYIATDEFYDRAVFKEQGDTEPNGFEYKTDCWNLKHHELNRQSDVPTNVTLEIEDTPAKSGPDAYDHVVEMGEYNFHDCSACGSRADYYARDPHDPDDVDHPHGAFFCQDCADDR